MPADKKDEILPNQLGFTEHSGKLIGAHGLTGWVKKNLSSTPMFCEQVEACRDNLALSAVPVTADALEEFSRNGISMAITRLANEVNVDLQIRSPW